LFPCRNNSIAGAAVPVVSTIGQNGLVPAELGGLDPGSEGPVVALRGGGGRHEEFLIAAGVELQGVTGPDEGSDPGR